MWHLWDRAFRPTFGKDAAKFNDEKKKKLGGNSDLEYFDNKKHALKIRREILADKEYRKFMLEKWGLDLLGR